MRKPKTPNRKPKERFAILVDGECESWYIQMMRLHQKNLKVAIEPKIPQKKKLKDLFAEAVELSNHYDKVFWVVDWDVINKESAAAKPGTLTPRQEFQNFINKNTTHQQIITIINNPCLEYWFLLHYVKTTKFFDNCQKATKELRKHLPDYKKTRHYFTKENDDIYLKLSNRLALALENAEVPGNFDFQNPDMGISQMGLLFRGIGLFADQSSLKR